MYTFSVCLYSLDCTLYIVLSTDTVNACIVLRTDTVNLCILSFLFVQNWETFDISDISDISGITLGKPTVEAWDTAAAVV